MDISTTLISSSTIPSVISSDALLSIFQGQFLWALIVGFLLAYLLGFGMGANDVANAFGTSVGSKVLSLKMAYILATIMEALGAILVGYNVTDTMRKSVVETSLYDEEPGQFIAGQIAILGGGGLWLLIATALKLPVSTTHSIVGATLGFSLVLKGFDGIHWTKVRDIAFSWVLSPMLSGLVSASLYMIVDFAVLRRRNPLKCGLRALPIFYFFCIAFNAFAVTYSGSKVLGLSDIPFWLSLCISIALGAIVAIIVQFIVRPKIVQWIQNEDATKDANNNFNNFTVILPKENPRISVISLTSTNGMAAHPKPISFTDLQLSTDVQVNLGQQMGNAKIDKRYNLRRQSFYLTPKGLIRWFFPRRERQEDAQTLKMFSTIQIFTACFAGFAHGANDVANAIAPLVALMAVYKSMDVEQAEPTPIWLILYGVLAICTGLWILGHRVIKTVGQKMSEINPCSGFTIEFGAAVTALVASKLGLPISTTHCLVGSVVAVGTVKAGEGIDWRLFASIALSWVVTLPISAILSAGIMWILKAAFF